MRAALLVLALVWAFEAHAAGCSKVEYADARDWPLDKAEKQYCRAVKFNEINAKQQRDLRAAGLLSARDSQSIVADISSCADQQAMFGRVIENVHKRPLPAC